MFTKLKTISVKKEKEKYFRMKWKSKKEKNY